MVTSFNVKKRARTNEGEASSLINERREGGCED
jgi:hypothetical protein